MIAAGVKGIAYVGRRMAPPVDAEAVGIAWIKEVVKEEDDIEVGRSISQFDDKWKEAITVARTGSGGQITQSGLLWEWELGISVWVKTRGTAQQDRIRVSWSRCSEIVDIICDTLARFDDIGSTERDTVTAGNIEGASDTVNLIFVRMTGAPRRRESDPQARARIDFEIVITMGRD